MRRFGRKDSLEARQAAIELELARRAGKRAAVWRRASMTPGWGAGRGKWTAFVPPGCAVAMVIGALAFVGAMLAISGLLTGW